MEEDKLKSLFAEYRPELSPERDFLVRLERNLESVEIIREQNEKMRQWNKIACLLSAGVGFVVGFLFSLCIPFIGKTVSQWHLTLPKTSVWLPIADYYMVISWVVILITTTIITLNAYEITLSVLKRKSNG